MADKNDLFTQQKYQREIKELIEEKLKLENEYLAAVKAGNVNLSDMRKKALEARHEIPKMQAEFRKLTKIIDSAKTKLKEIGEGVSENIQGPFDKLKDTLESLPFGNLLSKMGHWDKIQKDLSTRLQWTFRHGDIGTKNLAKGFGHVANASGAMLKTIMGPVGLLAGFVLLFKAAWDMNKAMASFGKEMGVGIDRAEELSRISDKLTFEENQESVKALAGQFNGLLTNSQELVESVGNLHHNYGLSYETGAKLTKNSIALRSTNEEITNQVAKQLSSLKAQGITAVSFGQVMRDISELSHSTLSDFRGNHKALIAGVVQARLLGTSLEEIKEQARGTLNIEQSLGSQYEAQVLTGKKLSMDALRAAALFGDQNDMLDAQKTVIQEIGSYQELQNMNYLQRKKLAESLNMTEDQLLDRSMAIHSLGKLGLDQDKMAKMNSKQLLELAKTTSDETAKTYLTQQANRSASEEWERSMTQLKEAFAPILSSLIEMVTPIAQVVGYAASLLKSFNGLPAKILAIIALWKVFNMVRRKGGGIASSMLDGMTGPPNGGGGSGFDITDLLGRGKKGKGGIGRLFKSLFKSKTAWGGPPGKIPKGFKFPKGGGNAITRMFSGSGKALATGAKGVLGKVAAPLEILMGAATGFSQTSNTSAAEKKAQGIKESMGTTEGTIQGALTGGAEKGSMFSESLGVKKGSAADEALGIAAAGGRGALAGAAIGSLAGPVGTAVGAAVGGIVGTVSEGFKVFSDPNSSLRKGIIDFADEATTKIGGWASSAKDMVGDFFQGHVNLAKKAGGFVSNLLGFNSSEANSPRMATGGIVSTATKAIVGEAGPEAVVPLDKFYAKLDAIAAAINNMSGGGTGNQPVTLHIHFDDGTVQKIGNRNTYLQRNGAGLGIRKV